MLPIPVALLALGADGLAIEASNRAFHDAGFALDRRPSALIRALGTEIADFLASGDDQYEMTWQAGDPIECRHYRVTLARAYHSGGTRCLVTLVDRTAEVRTEQHLRRSEEHTSELQSLMRISSAVFCLKKKRRKSEVQTVQVYTK